MNHFGNPSNFQDVSSYPYQYKTYDRDVTAECSIKWINGLVDK